MLKAELPRQRCRDGLLLARDTHAVLHCQPREMCSEENLELGWALGQLLQQKLVKASENGAFFPKRLDQESHLSNDACANSMTSCVQSRIGFRVQRKSW